MGKRHAEPELDLKNVLTTIATVSGWQQRLALEALRQLESDASGDSEADPPAPGPQQQDA